MQVGRITRPDVCRCGSDNGGRSLLAYLPDPVAPVNVEWLCVRCYRKVKPARLSGPRGDIARKCPPYEVMVHDFVTLGMTYEQMGAKYGVLKRNVHNCLRDRARRRGEWPLRQRREGKGHTVQPAVIAHLVEEYIREQYTDRPVVRVGTRKITLYAPHTKMVMARRGETVYLQRRPIRGNSADPVVYHNIGCTKLLDHDGHAVPSVLMDVEEAKRWGYVPCKKCRQVLQIKAFCKAKGFNYQFIQKLVTGRMRKLSRSQARRLLLAIGEPVPDWMDALERATAA